MQAAPRGSRASPLLLFHLHSFFASRKKRVVTELALKVSLSELSSCVKVEVDVLGSRP